MPDVAGAAHDATFSAETRRLVHSQLLRAMAEFSPSLRLSPASTLRARSRTVRLVAAQLGSQRQL
jgi:hypothetical protein